MFFAIKNNFLKVRFGWRKQTLTKRRITRPSHQIQRASEPTPPISEPVWVRAWFGQWRFVDSANFQKQRNHKLDFIYGSTNQSRFGILSVLEWMENLNRNLPYNFFTYRTQINPNLWLLSFVESTLSTNPSRPSGLNI